MIVVNIPKPVREYRFVANLREDDLPAFREALVDLADGFTEIGTSQGTRCIVGLRGRGARQRLQRLLAEWEPRARQGKIDLEDCSTAADRDEIYFLLPLQRNPDPAGGPRRPLFTNEQWAGFRDELARRFRFRPEMVRVYGEWRNDAGQLMPTTRSSSVCRGVVAGRSRPCGGSSVVRSLRPKAATRTTSTCRAAG